MEINAQNIKEAWIKALQNIIKNGRRFKDRMGRVCIERDDMLLHIANIEDAIREPINIILKVTKFMYPSFEEMKNVIFSKQRSTYNYTYGKRIFSYDEKIDQIHDYIIPLLQENPQSRQGIVNIYNAVKDVNSTTQIIPSWCSIYICIREEKLHMTAHIRSNDIFVGLPANGYQLYILQKYIAQKLQKATGKLSIFSNSAHIFEDQLKDIEKVIKE